MNYIYWSNLKKVKKIDLDLDSLMSGFNKELAFNKKRAFKLEKNWKRDTKRVC
jgi:hypothetical protein